MPDDIRTCHCGRPLHYTDPEIERKVTALIEKLGENILIISTASGRSGWV
jgi:hypothetical protein